MPYITKEEREKFEKGLNDLAGISKTPGELNYVFTRICLDYLNFKGMNYQNMNDIVGALENCKLELYRRHIAGYEDIKIISNGDVA